MKYGTVVRLSILTSQARAESNTLHGTLSLTVSRARRDSWMPMPETSPHVFACERTRKFKQCTVNSSNLCGHLSQLPKYIGGVGVGLPGGPDQSGVPLLGGVNGVLRLEKKASLVLLHLAK